MSTETWQRSCIFRDCGGLSVKTYEGHIKYNENEHCYGMVGNDGNWVKEKLEHGERIDVVINGEQFATNFKCEYKCPALQPHAWDNWDYLCGLPATYYDFEITPPKQPLTEKEKRRLRYGIGLASIALSLVVSVLMGALFALIAFDGSEYLKHFTNASIFMFFFLGGGFAAGGVLLILNILPENLCIGFGCALYYGTILLSGFLSDFIYGPDSNRCCISFVIVSLVCYIVWLRKFKPDKAS